jgi:hypothetical protein
VTFLVRWVSVQNAPYDSSHITGPGELAPYLQKLEGHPGSVILIAIEVPEVCNFARTTCAWLSAGERKALKSALEACRRKREKSHDVDRGGLVANPEGKDSGAAEESHRSVTPRA